jgi:hypothetical protein
MKCFVISPIGDDGTEIRKQSDQVLEFIVKEALQPLGYQVDRADTIAESGLITTQIIERITSCDLLVADLSRHNANVFYELAIRHVTGKPFIHLIEDGQKIPFDVSASRTILYSLDLMGARRAKDELQQQAKAILSGTSRVESPVSIAVDFKALSSRDDPVSSALQRIERELQDIRQSLDKAEWSEAAGKTSLLRHIFVKPSQIQMAEAEASRQSIFLIDPDALSETGWTDKRVELLKEMWSRGSSAADIARLLGLSRNAVIGKIHRLGLDDKSNDDDKE